jgi:hypothetical protein
MAKRAAIYLPVSSERQAGPEEVNIEITGRPFVRGFEMRRLRPASAYRERRR